MGRLSGILTVPWWRVHTQISCNVGDLSMVVPHKGKVEINNYEMAS